MLRRLALGLGLLVVLTAAPATGLAARGAVRPGHINVVYGPTKTADEKTLMSLVRVSRLKDVMDILSKQLILPHDLTIYVTRENVGPAYYAKYRTIAFDLPFALLELNVIKGENPKISGYDLGVGFASVEYFVLFHELGHALVDQWKIPVLGREEDAVDAFSTIMMVTINQPKVALWGADFFNALGSGKKFGSSDFADEHSLSPQRAYSIACWVYGADPKKFAFIADVLPKERLVRCPAEYKQLKDAWYGFLKPHLRTS